jgi:hypothetical protein
MSGTGASVSHSYATAGTYTVTLTATDADGGTVAGTTATTVTVSSGSSGLVIVDDSQTGFAEMGSGWQSWPAGYDGEIQYNNSAPPGQATASWQAAGLAPGLYTIQASWGAATWNTTAAVYQIYDGSTLVKTVTANQEQTLSGSTYTGVYFNNLTTVQINSGTVKVVLSSQATGTLVADAVAIGLANNIVTAAGVIPNFGANPTITSVQSGNWSDPNTWSLGRIPTDGDIVDVSPNTTVTYDVNSTARLNTLEIQYAGSLKFRTDINTMVLVANFLVLPGGDLEVGTPANPVAANVMAQIFIANQAINTALDPEQFGTGLIVLGSMTTNGEAKTPYIALSQEAHAGDTALHLAAPATGWQVGDVLELTDTRELNWNERGNNYVPQWEQLTIRSISADGLTVTLSAPLSYDHLGARDANGVLQYLPQVANVSRNVMIASEDVTAGVNDTRGYTLFMDRANVSMQNTGFCELGRTTNAPDDNTTYNTGTVSHLGTNQGDRMAMTAVNLIGPTTSQANGYQFTFSGDVVNANCVVCTNGTADFTTQSIYRWGIGINNSDYGLIQDNVVYNAAGAGIVTESGTESYNVFDGNFVARVNGTGDRYGMGSEGVGYWFRGPNNYYRNNIATDINQGGVYSYGFNLFFRYLGTQNIPAYQGADPSVPGQYVTLNLNASPILQFENNEVYGATPNGMTYWWVNAYGASALSGTPSTIKNFTVWNQYQWGVFGYESNQLTIDGLTVRGDQSIMASGNGAQGMIFMDYFSKDLVITHADIQDEAVGITPSTLSGGGTQTIEISYLDNLINIDITTLWGVNESSAGIPARKVVIDNVQFAAPLASSLLVAIDMSYSTQEQGPANLIQLDQVFVYNYDQVSGYNFQVYYTQQSATFIVPQTTYNADQSIRQNGAPVAGLTNTQTWAQYGIAIAGAVAPSSATTLDGVDGLITLV